MNNFTAQQTIGLFTTIGVEDQYQIGILRGAIAAAEEHNINLIVFGGGVLDSSTEDQINRNVIYDLAAPTMNALDGIIVFAGTLMSLMSAEKRSVFCAQYKIPIVSIGLDLSEHHSVLLNNHSGIRDIMMHLITVHGYRHIAFIQGPEGNNEASQRFQAYLDTLSEFDIPFDRLLVVKGNFQDKSGASAVHVLLDERHVVVEAIVCANDNTAMGAIYELRKMGVQVPGNIAVVGFDDVDDAEAIIPALTTVRQPLYEQGKQGIDLILSLLEGVVSDSRLVLKPDLVLRRSCGCFSSAVVDLKADRLVSDTVSAEAIEKTLIDSKPTILEAILEVVPNSQNAPYLGKLYDVFLGDLLFDKHSEQTSQFISLLDVVTRHVLLENAQIHRWHEILTVMRRAMVPLLGANIQLRTRAENLWQQARILISEAIQHSESNRRLQIKLQAQALNAIGEPVVTGVADIANLMSVMADEFPTLGVRSCYLAFYEDDSHKWSRLVFSYTQGDEQPHTSVAENQRRFLADQVGAPPLVNPDRSLSHDLISQILMTSKHRQSLLVQALYFDSTQFGFMILEIERPEPYIYEALRKQFSSSFHTSFLMRQLGEKQMLLEQALQDIKTAQAMLVHTEKMSALGQMVAGVAHEINNPLSFVYSNVHSLSKTFDEFSTAYNDLESLVRETAHPIEASAVDHLRRKGGVEFLIEDTHELVDDTLSGLKRVKTIVEELRKFSRLDEAEFKISNLRENVESTLLVARGTLGKQIAVEIDIDPNLAFTCAAAQLNQVILNMIINGGQAIEGEGIIYISAQEQVEHVVIQIRDTGSGMPEHVMAHIFDPFFTTKAVGVGTGLGLSISHKIIVDGHKGTISVASTPDIGTTFTIRLPKNALPSA